MPVKVTDAEFVSVVQVQHFFTHLAWQDVNDALASVKKINIWLCHACQNELSGWFAVGCFPCFSVPIR